jgi:hypothetical protein
VAGVQPVLPIFTAGINSVVFSMVIQVTPLYRSGELRTMTTLDEVAALQKCPAHLAELPGLKGYP